ncbi:MAG: iron chelate uptake ABC transporter family permease subunit [Tissierellia bacterium]|nr:iron chelate uptake ABC transporter family permease subunit [Tissierellia bacterium]
MKKWHLFLLLIILSIISLLVGVIDISLGGILSLKTDDIQILLLSRLPRLISIITAGAGMSISGLIMQQLSRNKFVSPTTAATEDSAKLGVLAAMILFPAMGSFYTMIVSFIFSIGGTYLFMLIIRKVKFKNLVYVPLIGIMLGNVIGSISTYLAYSYDVVQNISSWLLGDFSMIIKGRYELLYISIPLIVIAFIYANKFTIAGMGEDFAKNLGLNYKQVMNIGLIIVSLISSLVIITVGKIPFLGLVVPNMVSLLKGDNTKENISVTALFGAIFLLVCDIFGRLIIYPYELSISLTVGIIGSIIFLYLIIRGKSNG